MLRGGAKKRELERFAKELDKMSIGVPIKVLHEVRGGISVSALLSR